MTRDEKIQGIIEESSLYVCDNVSEASLKVILQKAYEAGRQSVREEHRLRGEELGIQLAARPWPCDESPTGFCCYDKHGRDECDYCGDPFERK